MALAVLGIVLAGLVPITHAQLRLMERLESDYPESQNHILAPLGDRWARKLGAPALLDPPLLPPVVPVPSDPGYSLELLQFNTDSTADITAARVRLIPVP